MWLFFLFYYCFYFLIIYSWSSFLLFGIHIRYFFHHFFIVSFDFGVEHWSFMPTRQKISKTKSLIQTPTLICKHFNHWVHHRCTILKEQFSKGEQIWFLPLGFFYLDSIKNQPYAERKKKLHLCLKKWISSF